MQPFYQLRITMKHKFLRETRGATSRNSFIQIIKSATEKEMLKWLWSNWFLLFWLIFHKRGPFLYSWKISVTVIVILRHEANWLMGWKLELCLNNVWPHLSYLPHQAKENTPRKCYNLWSLWSWIKINFTLSKTFQSTFKIPYILNLTEKKLLNDPHKMNCGHYFETLDQHNIWAAVLVLSQSGKSFSSGLK